ncbi:MAG: 3'-5' exonuclease [Chlamydiales bacterium]
MLLIFLDSETTGLNPERHRIVQIAFKVIETVSRRPVLSYESIISQPQEVWAEADPKSLQINGFTWEESLGGKSERTVAAEISNDLNHLSIGEKEGVFICQNPSFDRSFFNQLIGVELQQQYNWPYHWLDLASMYWAVQILQSPEKANQLKENDLSKNKIAKHYGLSPENQPHRAMNGVNHLIACYEAIFGKFLD